MSELAVEHTGRGFAISKFVDRYGHECSIQDSSIATEPCIWLGLTKDGRAHLTVDHVRSLLPLLSRFVETGSIAP